MRYVGIGLSHDAGLTIIGPNGNVEFLGQAERYCRIKHYSRDLSPIQNAFPSFGTLRNTDVVVISHFFDSRIEPWMAAYENIATTATHWPPTLVQTYEPRDPNNSINKFLGVNPQWCIDHHLAHTLASWVYRPDDDERMFMAYDGNGPDAQQQFKASLTGYINEKHFAQYLEATPIPSAAAIHRLMGPYAAGKAMGLAGYVTNPGEWDEKRLLKTLLHYTSEQYHQFPEEWKHGIRLPSFQLLKLDQDAMRFVAAFYKWHILHFIGEVLIKNYQQLGKGRGLVISGGTSLALELNTTLYNLTQGNIVFGPPADDSGLSLGCAAFGYFMVNGRWPKIHTPSLNALQEDLPAQGPQRPKEIAALLAQNKVVALLRGQAEVGPRALGYRSILAAPSLKENLPRVSQEIKGREFYRPLAPLVTEEQFDRFFQGPKGHYMQYRVTCTPEAEQLLPAIVHNDQSARPQVVSPKTDSWLHELLVEYGKLTGHECLINTSLNKNGKPICNTLQDALDDMAGKNVIIASLPTRCWKPPQGLML